VMWNAIKKNDEDRMTNDELMTNLE
jgi:hypothetical protein